MRNKLYIYIVPPQRVRDSVTIVIAVLEGALKMTDHWQNAGREND